MKVWSAFVVKKSVNNRPSGENSPNLVTLTATLSFFDCSTYIFMGADVLGVCVFFN
jgi:hypothetical protein